MAKVIRRGCRQIPSRLKVEIPRIQFLIPEDLSNFPISDENTAERVSQARGFLQESFPFEL
jgi:ribosomal protein L31E